MVDGMMVECRNSINVMSKVESAGVSVTAG
jgi:hypothetical protein